jgi:hypothetical protein
VRSVSARLTSEVMAWTLMKGALPGDPITPDGGRGLPDAAWTGAEGAEMDALLTGLLLRIRMVPSGPFLSVSATGWEWISGAVCDRGEGREFELALAVAAAESEGAEGCARPLPGLTEGAAEPAADDPELAAAGDAVRIGGAPPPLSRERVLLRLCTEGGRSASRSFGGGTKSAFWLLPIELAERWCPPAGDGLRG